MGDMISVGRGYAVSANIDMLNCYETRVDLQAIGGLTDLVELTIQSCSGVADLSPLSASGVAHLRLIDCYDAIDLAAIANMKLKSLGIERCRIRDLTPILSVQSLESIVLKGIVGVNDGVYDLGSLAQAISKKRVSDSPAKPDDAGKSVQIVCLDGDLMPGVKSTKHIIDLSKMKPTFHDGEDTVIQIGGRWVPVTAKELDLSQVSVVVDDLSQVAELKSLVSLNLSGCGVADLSPLVELKDLTELNLMGCMDIADLSPLAKLKNLEVLNLMYCPGITDPSPLLLLPVLRKLHVYGSGINDYDPIMDGMEYLKRYAKRKSGVVATTPTFDASASAGMGDRLTITGSNGPKNDTSDFKFTPFKEMDMRDTATKTGTLIVPKEAVTFHLSAPPAQPKTKQGAFALLRCGDDWVLQMKDQQHRGGATGKLCLFGGWQDGDESQTTNLMRELQEEFGIKEADVAHVGDIPLSVDGGNFVYHVFYAKVPALPPQQCNEGVAVKMSNVDLTALLMKEGIPLLSGPKKGTVQLVFMPAIAEACRMVLSAHTYLHPKPSKA